ncbi:unnamed protein product, partial [Mycena citricolor]
MTDGPPTSTVAARCAGRTHPPHAAQGQIGPRPAQYGLHGPCSSIPGNGRPLRMADGPPTSTVAARCAGRMHLPHAVQGQIGPRPAQYRFHRPSSSIPGDRDPLRMTDGPPTYTVAARCAGRMHLPHAVQGQIGPRPAQYRFHRPSSSIPGDRDPLRMTDGPSTSTVAARCAGRMHLPHAVQGQIGPRPCSIWAPWTLQLKFCSLLHPVRNSSSVSPSPHSTCRIHMSRINCNQTTFYV